jgi:hypothetical protein
VKAQGTVVATERPSGERNEVRNRLASYRHDSDQLLALRDELLDRYPNQWVAIHAGEIFHAHELDALFASLRLRNIEPSRVPREYLTRDQPALLL